MTLSVEQIAGDSSFLPALASFGARMKDVYDEHQRLAGNFSFHRRWLISQAAMALYWDSGEALTVSRLVAVLKPFEVASPNTIRDFMDELEACRFIIPDPEFTSLRPRYWRPSSLVVDVVSKWFAANLAILDGLDGGDRAPRFLSEPELLSRIQPRLAWHCLEDRRWRIPPKRIAFLLTSISGGLVMDHIAILVGNAPRVGNLFMIPTIDAHAIASQIRISRTHLQRTLNKVMQAGALGWQGQAFESDMWVDSTFIEEYCGWQAVKSHYLDEAFEMVCWK